MSWLLAQPDKEELVRACYYDRPGLAAAQRYWSDPEWQAIRALLPPVKGKVLDAGAGMGIASYALARDGWATTALEPDPSALVGAQAIKALGAESGLAIDVVQEWGERLPFRDCTFDLVHARQVLHHARDLTKFCAELFRVLVPGGMLVATREHVVSSPAQLPAFLEKHDLHRYYGGENAFMLDEYRSALLAAGFRITDSFGPLESVINFAPFTQESLCAEIARRAAKIPGGRAIANLLLSKPIRTPMLRMLSALDNRPGRLYTFICRRE